MGPECQGTEGKLHRKPRNEVRDPSDHRKELHSHMPPSGLSRPLGSSDLHCSEGPLEPSTARSTDPQLLTLCLWTFPHTTVHTRRVALPGLSSFYMLQRVSPGRGQTQAGLSEEPWVENEGEGSLW